MSHSNHPNHSYYALDLVQEAVVIADSDFKVSYLNSAAEDLCACADYEIQGQQLSQVLTLIDGVSREKISLPVQQCLQQNRTIKITKHVLLLDKNGNEHSVEITFAPYPPGNEVQGVIILLKDLSETQQLAEQLSHEISHDTLTGLMNRQAFERQLTHHIDGMKTYEVEHCLCYIDIHQFKIINNQAGHIVGNQILQEIAEILANSTRSIDKVARIEGDEFALLLVNKDLKQSQRVIQLILDKIRDHIFSSNGFDFECGLSTGIVAISENTDEPAQILTHGELACNSAKLKGINQIHIFSDDDYELTRQHKEIMRAGGIKEAISEDRFSLYCQPIVSLPITDESVQHYELLLRLQDTNGNILLPASFIPAAERFGLMTTLDRWVIETACSRYHKIFGRDSQVHIAINLSGHSLNDDDLFDFIVTQFDTHSIDPSLICFEITETAAIDNLEQAKTLITRLKAMGSRFALDDFGSGLSSFAYLKHLPIDYLKIDGSFVIDMNHGSRDNAMVEVINQLGHLMGIRTIAECAESHEVVDQLSKLGVDYAQGYAMGSPMPLDGLTIIH